MSSKDFPTKNLEIFREIPNTDPQAERYQILLSRIRCYNYLCTENKKRWAAYPKFWNYLKKNLKFFKFKILAFFLTVSMENNSLQIYLIIIPINIRGLYTALDSVKIHYNCTSINFTFYNNCTY